MRYHLDYETFSALPIKRGHIPYAMHDSTEVLMCAYAAGDGEVYHWDAVLEPIPQALVDILLDDTGIKWAQNASFEIAVTVYTLIDQCGLREQFDAKFPTLESYIKTWRCSMVQGMAMSLPASLKQQGEVLRSKEVKTAEEGRNLIHKFCKPTPVSKNNPRGRWDHVTSPDKWDAFCSYNIQDVVAERANWHKTKRFPLPDHEWDLWHLDQLINFTGLPVDTDLVAAAIAIDEQVKEINKKELKEITGLSNPNSRSQILPWLQERGYPLDTIRKDDIAGLLKTKADNGLDNDVARVLELRLLTSKNSTKKFLPLRDSTVGGRLFGCFQFCGASRTWRWAGRIFQPQNLARGILKVKENKDGTLNTSQVATAIDMVKVRDLEFLTTMELIEDVPDLLSSLVRPSISSPSPDKVLTVADLASIETIMVGWAAKSEQMVKVFAQGLDPYCDYGSSLLKKSYEEIKANKILRNFCKPVVLGGGYMLGPDGLIAYAALMGVHMTFKEACKAIDVYRTKYPDVVNLWDKLDKAARRCITERKEVCVNGYFTFRFEKPCMTIELPSGRKLVYVRPRIEPREFNYRDRKTGKMKSARSDAVTYEGLNQITRQWQRISTHAGKITENIVQAIARDVLAHGLMKCHENGMEIIGHVHDEILALTPWGEDQKQLLVDCMTDRPSWCPDAPLSSSVYQSPFYVKD